MVLLSIREYVWRAWGGRHLEEGRRLFMGAVQEGCLEGMGSFALQNEIPQDFGHLYLSHSAF